MTVKDTITVVQIRSSETLEEEIVYTIAKEIDPINKKSAKFYKAILLPEATKMIRLLI
jgi:hypothetical protein